MSTEYRIEKRWTKVTNGIYLALLMPLYVSLSTAFLTAAEKENIDRAISTVTLSLPSGWTIANVKSNEIPYGHHWGENYIGPTGTLVILKGIRPVNAEFSDANGKWRAARVATESLEIWLMPSNYSDSRFAWLSSDRPVQPIAVINHGLIKVYASQWALLLSDKDFNELLKKSTGVRWPDPQVDSAKFLTWNDWRQKLRIAIEKQFAATNATP
jgi:hypothetical protein